MDHEKNTGKLHCLELTFAAFSHLRLFLDLRRSLWCVRNLLSLVRLEGDFRLRISVFEALRDLRWSLFLVTFRNKDGYFVFNLVDPHVCFLWLVLVGVKLRGIRVYASIRFLRTSAQAELYAFSFKKSSYFFQLYSQHIIIVFAFPTQLSFCFGSFSSISFSFR